MNPAGPRGSSPSVNRTGSSPWTSRRTAVTSSWAPTGPNLGSRPAATTRRPGPAPGVEEIVRGSRPLPCYSPASRRALPFGVRAVVASPARADRAVRGDLVPPGDDRCNPGRRLATSGRPRWRRTRRAGPGRAGLTTGRRAGGDAPAPHDGSGRPALPGHLAASGPPLPFFGRFPAGFSLSIIFDRKGLWRSAVGRRARNPAIRRLAAVFRPGVLYLSSRRIHTYGSGSWDDARAARPSRCGGHGEGAGPSPMWRTHRRRSSLRPHQMAIVLEGSPIDPAPSPLATERRASALGAGKTLRKTR